MEVTPPQPLGPLATYRGGRQYDTMLLQIKRALQLLVIFVLALKEGYGPEPRVDRIGGYVARKRDRF